MKLSNISNVVSISRFPYGHDPAHYPIKGIKYVLQNMTLWKKVAAVACIGAIIWLLCLILLFVFALEPQAQAIGGKQWWSWLIAVLLVLLEAAVLAAILLVVVQARSQKEIFCATMQLENKWREGEMKKPSILKEFNIFKRAMFVRILTFPVNVIPFVGAAMYSAINGTYVGWDYMDLYFECIGMDGRSQRIEVFGEDKSDCRSVFSPYTYDPSNQYCRFGFMCAMIEAVPLIGATVFPLTNACAAALFACDIESRGGPRSLIKDDYAPPSP